MLESQTITIQDRAAAIEKAWEYFIVSEEARAAHKRPYVYASAWTPCDRRMVLPSMATIGWLVSLSLTRLAIQEAKHS